MNPLSSAYQLRIAQLETALAEIEAHRLTLNPIHFDSQHKCGQFMQFIYQTVNSLALPTKKA
jgi:uncharacterized protein